MAMKLSLVKFKGKSGQSNYLVLTEDVQGFKPKSALDITDKEYLVKWQDSFHDDEADVHHNGCYPATVLLVGATVEELRAKAKELKIKFPSRLPLPHSSDSKPMKKPLKKRRHQKTDVDLRETSKKKRMMETEGLFVNSETSFSPKKPSSGSRDNSLKSGSGHHSSRAKSLPAEKAAANEKQSLLMKSQSVTNSKTDLKVVHSSQSAHLQSRSKSFSAHEASPKSEEQTSLKNSPLKNSKTGMRDVHSPTSPPFKLSDQRSESGHHHSSQKFVNAVKVSPSKSKQQTFQGEMFQSSYHPKTDLKDNHLIELGCSNDPGNKTCSLADMIIAQRCDNQLFKEMPPIVKKTSPVKRGSGDSDTDQVSSDEDDPTVLLDQLNKEHKNCTAKIEFLVKENEKLNQRVVYEVAKRKQNELKLQKEISELRTANFSLKLKLNKTVLGHGGSSPAVSEDCVSTLSFPRSETSPVSMIKLSSDPMFSSPSSPTFTVKEERGLKLGNVSKQLFKEDKNLSTKKNLQLDSPCGGSSSESSMTPGKKEQSTLGSEMMASQHPLKKEIKSTDSRGKKNVSISKEDEDEFGSGYDGVSRRIEADLRGIKPLQGNEKKVNVGMGLQISRKSWEKSIRVKTDDSKFLKDSAGVIWGREALQARTGFRQTGSKKACTPKKVELLHAMLKGKMNARDEDSKQQKFIIENFAPKWLTAKCYDSGRKPKPPKVA